MASYSFSNISPVYISSVKPNEFYSALNEQRIRDNDFSTWARIKYPTSSTNLARHETTGFRLYFNFSTMPNGKVLPDDATVNSWTIWPQSFCYGSSTGVTSSNKLALGLRYLTRRANNSDNVTIIPTESLEYIQDDDNAVTVAEEVKSVCEGDGSNRFVFYSVETLNAWWSTTGDTPGSHTYDIQNGQYTENRCVELVGFSNNSLLQITPQTLKETFTLSSGIEVCCLEPAIVSALYWSSQYQPNRGLGLNEVYANLSVTLPEIQVNAEKEAPYGHNFTITGSGGDNNWSWNETTQVGTITTDAWGGSTQSNITLTASNIPNDCYFVGWYKNGELIPGSGLSINFQPTENATYTAQIALKPIITFSATEGGRVTVTTEGGEITSGTPVDIGTYITVVMTAENQQYYFDSYTLNGSATRPSEVYKYTFFYTVNADTDIYATFINNPVVTLSVQNANQNEQDSAGVEVSWDGSGWGSVVMENTMRPSGTLYCYAKDGDDFYFKGPMVDEFGTELRWSSTRGCYEYDIPDKFQGRYSNIALFAYQKQKPYVAWAPYYIERNKVFPQVTEGGSKIAATVGGQTVTPGLFKPGTVINFTDTPNSVSDLPHTEWGMWVTSAGEFLSSDISFNYTVPSEITDVAVIGGTYEWPSIQIHQYAKGGGTLPSGHGCTVEFDKTRVSGGDETPFTPDINHTIKFIPDENYYVHKYTQLDGTEVEVPGDAKYYEYVINVPKEQNISYSINVEFGKNPQLVTIETSEYVPSGKGRVDANGKFKVQYGNTTTDWIERFENTPIRPNTEITITASDDWGAVGCVTGFYYNTQIEKSGVISVETYETVSRITTDKSSVIRGFINFTGTEIASTQIPCAGTTAAGDVLTITANPSYTNRTSKVEMAATLAPVDQYRNLPYIQSTILPEVKSRLTTAYGTTIEQVDFICTKPANSDETNAVDTGWAWAIYHGVVPRRYNAGYTARWSRFYMTDQNSNEHVIKWQINRDTGDISYQFLSGKIYVEITNLSDIILYTSQKVRNRDASTYDWYYEGMSADEFDSLYAENELNQTNEEYIFQEGEAQHGFIAGHYRFDHWNNNGTTSIENPWKTTFSTATQSAETHEYTSNIDAYYRRYVTLTLKLHEEYPEAGSLTGAGNYDIGEDGSATAEITGIPNQGYTWRQWEKTDGSPISTENPYMCPLTQDETIVGRFWHQFMLTVKVVDETTLREAGTATGGGMHVVGEQVTIMVTPYNYYLFNEWLDEPGYYDNPRIITMPPNPAEYTAICTPKAKLVYEGGQTLYDKGTTQVVAVYQGDTEIELKLR